MASDYATGTQLTERGEKKQTVLGYISKLLYITCRWDLSTARPGRKLLIKQRGVGGAAFDIVSWTVRMGGWRRLESSVVTVVTAIDCCQKASWVAGEPFAGNLPPWNDPVSVSWSSPPHTLLHLRGPAENWWGRCLSLLDYRLDQVIHFDQWAISRCGGNIGLK